MVGVDGAQQKCAEFFLAAKFQKIARVRQFGDGSLRAFELGVKPVLQLIHRHVRRVSVVKFRERQRKFRAKLFERHFGFAGLRQDEIRSFENSRQVVNERS